MLYHAPIKCLFVCVRVCVSEREREKLKSSGNNRPQNQCCNCPLGSEIKSYVVQMQQQEGAINRNRGKTTQHERDMISICHFYIYATVCCIPLHCFHVYTVIPANGGRNPLTENRTKAKTDPESTYLLWGKGSQYLIFPNRTHNLHAARAPITGDLYSVTTTLFVRDFGHWLRYKLQDGLIWA